MQIRDPSDIPTDRGRYSPVAVALHWTTAAVILVQLLLGWRMEAAEGLGRASLLQLHKSVGIAILLLTAGRLAWRALNPPPPIYPSHSAIERRVARWTHGGFYGLLLALPLTGWALSSLTQSGGLRLFSILPWPAFPLIRALPGGAQDAAAAVADTAHSALVWVMLALLALHVVGALKHHFLSRDFTLARMIPGVRPGQAFNFKLAAVPVLALGAWSAVYLPKLPEKAPRTPPATLAQADLFLDVVQPMLDRRCSSCHSDGDARGAFSLSSYESLSQGGRSGPVVIPGDATHSNLFRRVTLSHSEAKFMPKGDRPALKPDEVMAVAAWIDVGAPGRGAVGDLKLSDKQKAVLGKLIGTGEAEAGGDARLLSGPRLPDVPKADEAVVRALEASGWVVRPVDGATNLLDVNFTVHRDLGPADYANLTKIGQQIFTLSVFQGGVKDTDLAVIAGFPNLMRLRLAANPITDAGAAELGRMKSLRQLTVAESELGDAGLLKLAEAPALERIYAWNTRATGAGAQRAEAGRPKLKVEVGLSRADVPAPGPMMQPVN